MDGIIRGRKKIMISIFGDILNSIFKKGNKRYCTKCGKETIHIKIKSSDKIAIFLLADIWKEECTECKNKISLCEPYI